MAQQYMFLLFDNEDWYDNTTPEDWVREMKLHQDFAAAVEAAGASIVAGAALQRQSAVELTASEAERRFLVRRRASLRV